MKPLNNSRTCGQRPSSGLTLVELLTVIAIIGILFGILVGLIFPQAIQQAKMAKSATNLRQLGTATQLYLIEHDDAFFAYREETEEGTRWFFGLEPNSSRNRGEGDRELDATQGPLYPYLQQIGGVEVCPGFDYNNALWKAKFQGASWGYGYNLVLSPIFYGNGEIRRPGKRMGDLPYPSQVILFATAAQVNTFQAPASPSNPMLEEFYYIDDIQRTVHFRFGNGEKALSVFADGHVRGMPPHPGTLDPRLPEARVGRLAPRGSLLYLE
jgi:prepilin-type N-terminal cleavage/methylation domain-containing protein